MYANLLITSMNLDTKSQVHPSFVDIIKQLSPADTKIIEEMKRKQTPLPIVTVKLNFEETKSFQELLIDYSTELFPLLGDIEILCTSLQNLNRLAIIKIRYDQVVKPDTRYDAFYNDGNYKQLVDQFGSIAKADIVFAKGLIELTEYGKLFCNVCCTE